MEIIIVAALAGFIWVLTLAQILGTIKDVARMRYLGRDRESMEKKK